MTWQQIYDPMGNMVLSTLLAAVPVVVMLVGLGFLHMKAHVAAAAGLIAALIVAIFTYNMPVSMAANAALYGGLTGLLPIGWIVLNIIFLHQLTEQNGSFKILQDSIAGITEDRRLQLLLIAFAFGAFFEGAAGFGTPVAVTAAILIGLGFSPLAASGLSLIANTAPVAFGALGTPILALAKVHGYDAMAVSAMVGRQLPFFSLLVPFWLIWAFAGRRAMMQIWPAILVTGGSFAIMQFLVSNYIGPELVDVIAAVVSMVSLVGFLKIWQPKEIWTSVSLKGHETDGGEGQRQHARKRPEAEHHHEQNGDDDLLKRPRDGNDGAAQGIDGQRGNVACRAQSYRDRQQDADHGGGQRHGQAFHQPGDDVVLATEEIGLQKGP